MAKKDELSKSLNELEGVAPPAPAVDSYLNATGHQLRSKPIGDFTVEDLRIMVGQRVGLRWLLPLALEAVEADPLAEGDFYAGDLLANVLGVAMEMEGLTPVQRRRVSDVVARIEVIPEELEEQVAAFRAWRPR